MPAVVELMWRSGYQIGPEPTVPCSSCGHGWGGHHLYPLSESAAEGGTWDCPEPGCSCFGLWDAPMPPDLRMAIEQRMLRRLDGS